MYGCKHHASCSYHVEAAAYSSCPTSGLTMLYPPVTPNVSRKSTKRKSGQVWGICRWIGLYVMFICK